MAMQTRRKAGALTMLLMEIAKTWTLLMEMKMKMEMMTTWTRLMMGMPDALGDSEADDADRISWLDEVVVQSPDLITEAISKGYAPQLWTDEKGWEEDCGTCPNRGEAVECSFCSLVYHNTNECIGAKNIVSEHSMEVGAHWACPGCWKEMRETAERKLLLPAQKAKLVRVRRRRRPADAHA